MDAQLVEEVVDVILDRRHFDAEPGGDFLVREVLADELRDLALAVSQERDGPATMVRGGELGDTPYEDAGGSG